MGLYDEAKVTFEELSLTDSGTLTTTLVRTNNILLTDDDPSNNSRKSDFATAKNFNTPESAAQNQ